MSYSFLDLAYDILKPGTQPMIFQKILQVAHDKGLTAKLETTGKTPWQSLLVEPNPHRRPIRFLPALAFLPPFVVIRLETVRRRFTVGG